MFKLLEKTNDELNSEYKLSKLVTLFLNPFKYQNSNTINDPTCSKCGKGSEEKKLLSWLPSYYISYQKHSNESGSGCIDGISNNYNHLYNGI